MRSHPKAAVWRSGQRGQCGDQGELLEAHVLPPRSFRVLTLSHTSHVPFTLRPGPGPLREWTTEHAWRYCAYSTHAICYAYDTDGKSANASIQKTHLLFIYNAVRWYFINPMGKPIFIEDVMLICLLCL